MKKLLLLVVRQLTFFFLFDKLNLKKLRTSKWKIDHQVVRSHGTIEAVRDERG